MKQNLYEIFYIDDLTPEEQENIYNLYKTSYEKSVGNAWDKSKFFERAEDWYFFGDQSGYVAARRQGSGMYKLAVVGGNIRGILKGMQELTSLNEPTWGMVSSDILPMMKKLGFKTPNALVMNTLLRIMPKEVFGGVNFKINLDGSITLNYEDTGSAKKYFVGNQQYFDWLKSQIKDKINPLKLTNLLKEVLNEAKQVGNLYHFTPLSNLKRILETQYIFANDEGQVSTSIRPNMATKDFQSMKNTSIARLMLDGDKISNKYKIQPFSYEEEDLGEEQIVVNNDKFLFVPYLKRIDIFLNKKEKVNPKILELLEKANIPYKIYQGTPISNIPYSQPKTGNPEDISIENIPKKQIYTPDEMYFPGMKIKKIKIIPYWSNWEVKNDLVSYAEELTVGVSSKYPDYYVSTTFLDFKNTQIYFNLKGEKINVKFIPIPMYNDPKWRKMWKTNVDPPFNYFKEGYTKDAYVLIPKNEV